MINYKYRHLVAHTSTATGGHVQHQQQTPWDIQTHALRSFTPEIIKYLAHNACSWIFDSTHLEQRKISLH